MKTLIISLIVITFLLGMQPYQAQAQEPVPCAVDYTTQTGDWLSKIADKYLGDVSAYDQIVNATNNQPDDRYASIADPDLIEPGWLLCIPEAAGQAEISADLAGTSWRWEQTLMNNDDMFVPDNPGSYNLEFMPDGTLAIQADCNQVGGTYSLDGSLISIQLGPSTMAACPEGSLGDQFVADLAAANAYFFDQGNLYIDLMYDSGTMQFSPQSSELAGTSWLVVGHNNGRQGVVSSIIGTEMTATFDADGAVSGSAGCNSYSAGYEVAGDAITILMSLSTTMMACAEPEGIMEQEQEFLTALQSAASDKITGDRLEMRTAERFHRRQFRAGGIDHATDRADGGSHHLPDLTVQPFVSS